jgi:chromosomal replication initiator protein
MGAVVPFEPPTTWEDAPIEPVDLPSMRQYRPIAHIQAIVAVSYGIPVNQMKAASRGKAVVWPRQVAMYLARELTLQSLPAIGRLFGGRDHSTVIWAIKCVEQRMASDPLYRADVEALREALS